MDSKYFTDSQKEFFKDLLEITKENDRKEIIIKILLEASKYYRITVFTMLNMSDRFLIRNIQPLTKMEYVISLADWLLGKKRDHVKDFLISASICHYNGNFLDFEILCVIDGKPVILLREIENYILHTTLNQQMSEQIANIIYGLETGKINRLIVTARTSTISNAFDNILGWNVRSYYDKNLSWLNELQ